MRNIRFDVNELKSIWRFSVGMSGVAISTIILMQLDKVLLSKLLSLKDFGQYMLAVQVANGLSVLLTSTFNVIYPRLSSLVAMRENEKIISLYRSGTCFLAVIVFPITIGAIVSSKDFLFLWTDNLSLATNTAPMLSLLLIGTAINGLMIFPYALQLAYGMTKLPLIIGNALTIIDVPLIFLFVMLYGAIGGALAWAVLNFMYLIFGTWITHRELLKGVGLTWLIRDVGIPLCLSLVAMIIGWEITHVEGAYVKNIVYTGVLAFFTIIVIALLLQGKMVVGVWRQFTKDIKQARCRNA